MIRHTNLLWNLGDTCSPKLKLNSNQKLKSNQKYHSSQSTIRFQINSFCTQRRINFSSGISQRIVVPKGRDLPPSLEGVIHSDPVDVLFNLKPVYHIPEFREYSLRCNMSSPDIISRIGESPSLLSPYDIPRFFSELTRLTLIVQQKDEETKCREEFNSFPNSRMYGTSSINDRKSKHQIKDHKTKESNTLSHDWTFLIEYTMKNDHLRCLGINDICEIINCLALLRMRHPTLIQKLNKRLRDSMDGLDDINTFTGVLRSYQRMSWRALSTIKKFANFLYIGPKSIRHSTENINKSNENEKCTDDIKEKIEVEKTERSRHEYQKHNSGIFSSVRERRRILLRRGFGAQSLTDSICTFNRLKINYLTDEGLKKFWVDLTTVLLSQHVKSLSIKQIVAISNSVSKVVVHCENQKTIMESRKEVCKGNHKKLMVHSKIKTGRGLNVKGGLNEIQNINDIKKEIISDPNIRIHNSLLRKCDHSTQGTDLLFRRAVTLIHDYLNNSNNKVITPYINKNYSIEKSCLTNGTLDTLLEQNSVSSYNDSNTHWSPRQVSLVLNAAKKLETRVPDLLSVACDFLIREVKIIDPRSAALILNTLSYFGHMDNRPFEIIAPIICQEIRFYDAQQLSLIAHSFYKQGVMNNKFLYRILQMGARLIDKFSGQELSILAYSLSRMIPKIGIFHEKFSAYNSIPNVINGIESNILINKNGNKNKDIFISLHEFVRVLQNEVIYRGTFIESKKTRVFKRKLELNFQDVYLLCHAFSRLNHQFDFKSLHFYGDERREPFKEDHVNIRLWFILHKLIGRTLNQERNWMTGVEPAASSFKMISSSFTKAGIRMENINSLVNTNLIDLHGQLCPKGLLSVLDTEKKKTEFNSSSLCVKRKQPLVHMILSRISNTILQFDVRSLARLIDLCGSLEVWNNRLIRLAKRHVILNLPGMTGRDASLLMKGLSGLRYRDTILVKKVCDYVASRLVVTMRGDEIALCVIACHKLRIDNPRWYEQMYKVIFEKQHSIRGAGVPALLLHSLICSSSNSNHDTPWFNPMVRTLLSLVMVHQSRLSITVWSQMQIFELWLKCLAPYDFPIDHDAKIFLARCRNASIILRSRSLTDSWISDVNENQSIYSNIKCNTETKQLPQKAIDSNQKTFHGNPPIDLFPKKDIFSSNELKCNSNSINWNNMRSSDLHKQISRFFVAVGIPHRNEVSIGPFRADFVVGGRIIFEVDGIYHFYHGTNTPTGFSILKHQLLSRLGFRVIHIPYQEWLQCGTPEKRLRYCASFWFEMLKIRDKERDVLSGVVREKWGLNVDREGRQL